MFFENIKHLADILDPDFILIDLKGNADIASLIKCVQDHEPGLTQ